MSNITRWLAPRRVPFRERQSTRTDVFSEVLGAVRVTDAVVSELDACSPCVGETPAALEWGPRWMPGAEQIVEYYLIAAGACSASVGEQAPVELEAGDVLLFPHPRTHQPPSAPQPRRPTERVRVIRGLLRCDARLLQPLLSTLPPFIHMPRRASGGVLEQLVELALAESLASRAGSASVLVRLGELLFVEVVRRYWATLPPQNVGWLAGLRDDNVGRVLGKLHERPAHAWTLNELAREGGMSRSVLAERFSHFVGIPPMQYLAEWRMQLATRLLSGTSLTLSEIAERVGYGSETALSRAYKRRIGLAPGEWKRRSQSVSPPCIGLGAA